MAFGLKECARGSEYSAGSYASLVEWCRFIQHHVLWELYGHIEKVLYMVVPVVWDIHPSVIFGKVEVAHNYKNL